MADTGSPAPQTSRRRRTAGDDEELQSLRRQLRRHPCHACPDREEHARWAERRARLERDTAALREKVANRTGSLARTFDRVCALLRDRGYLAGDSAAGDSAVRPGGAGGSAVADGSGVADGSAVADRSAGSGVTPAGRTLSRIWSEADLLVAECLRQGVWEGLDPAELVAAVSVVVYEARRGRLTTGSPCRADRSRTRSAPPSIALVGARGDRGGAGLQLTREPDLGFVWPIYRWARGESLTKVLASAAEAEMPAGDFVRWARQVVDLLGQIAEAAPGTARDGAPSPYGRRRRRRWPRSTGACSRTTP